MSQPNSLNAIDFKTWGIETAFFFTPAIVAGLLSYSVHLDITVALGAAAGALASSIVNLYGKYKAGVVVN